jgi:hypothetical protein
MKVYHGSYAEITHIDLAKCRSHRDFGRGFYVTRFRLHAEKWATNIARRYRKQGAVTEFEYRDNSFTRQICKKKIFDSYNEEWLDFVITKIHIKFVSVRLFRCKPCRAVAMIR